MSVANHCQPLLVASAAISFAAESSAQSGSDLMLAWCADFTSSLLVLWRLSPPVICVLHLLGATHGTGAFVPVSLFLLSQCAVYDIIDTVIATCHGKGTGPGWLAGLSVFILRLWGMTYY